MKLLKMSKILIISIIMGKLAPPMAGLDGSGVKWLIIMEAENL